MFSVHWREVVYRCPGCECTTSTSDNLILHIGTHKFCLQKVIRLSQSQDLNDLWIENPELLPQLQPHHEEAIRDVIKVNRRGTLTQLECVEQLERLVRPGVQGDINKDQFWNEVVRIVSMFYEEETTPDAHASTRENVQQVVGGALIGKIGVGGVNRQRDGGFIGGRIPVKVGKKHIPPGSAVLGTITSTSAATTPATATTPAHTRTSSPHMRIFGTTKPTSILGSELDKPAPPSSRPVVSPSPKQASVPGGGVERQQEDQLLISALLERRRLLEYECKNLKRKWDELEAEVEGETKEAEAQRKKMEFDPESASLDALVASLLATNDSMLSTSITAAKAGTTTLGDTNLNSQSKPIPTAPTIPPPSQSTEFIPTARPLPPPASPNHPLYRSFCPFRFSLHTITVLPISDTPATEPPTTITHHILKGHTPHHLLSFRFEFDVARPLVHEPACRFASQSRPAATTTAVVGGGGSMSTVAALPVTCVSTYAQFELHHILAIARQRRNLLLAMTALTEYHRLSTLRAEAFSLLSRIYSSLAEASSGQRKGGSSSGRGGGVTVVFPVDQRWITRNRRPRGRRASLLPFLGEREILFRGTTEAETEGESERENKRTRIEERDREEGGSGVQMLVIWDIDFDLATGLAESNLSVEVTLPGFPPGGPHARRKNLKATEPPSASPGEAMHAVKLDVEKAFAELVHHAGFVRAVRTVVGVLFDVHVKPDFGSGWAEGDGGGGGRIQSPDTHRHPQRVY